MSSLVTWNVTRYPGSGGQVTLFFLLLESNRGVVLRLHTKNQRPRCPGSGLKVPVGGWWVVVVCKPNLVNSIDLGSS